MMYFMLEFFVMIIWKYSLSRSLSLTNKTFLAFHYKSSIIPVANFNALLIQHEIKEHIISNWQHFASGHFRLGNNVKKKIKGVI